MSDSGQLLPIVPHRGNHESRPESIPSHFGTSKDSYGAFNIGSGPLSLLYFEQRDSGRWEPGKLAEI
jgi:hypothetical protein